MALNQHRIVVRLMEPTAVIEPAELEVLGRSMFGGSPPCVGKVIKVRAGGFFAPQRRCALRMGDTVIFDVSNGKRTRANGEDLVVLSEDEVFRVRIPDVRLTAQGKADEVRQLQLRSAANIAYLKRLTS